MSINVVQNALNQFSNASFSSILRPPVQQGYGSGTKALNPSSSRLSLSGTPKMGQYSHVIEAENEEVDFQHHNLGTEFPDTSSLANRRRSIILSVMKQKGIPDPADGLPIVPPASMLHIKRKREAKIHSLAHSPNHQTGKLLSLAQSKVPQQESIEQADSDGPHQQQSPSAVTNPGKSPNQKKTLDPSVAAKYLSNLSYNVIRNRLLTIVPANLHPSHQIVEPKKTMGTPNIDMNEKPKKVGKPECVSSKAFVNKEHPQNYKAASNGLIGAGKINEDLQAVGDIPTYNLGEVKPVKVPMLKYLNERVLKNRFHQHTNFNSSCGRMSLLDTNIDLESQDTIKRDSQSDFKMLTQRIQPQPGIHYADGSQLPLENGKASSLSTTSQNTLLKLPTIKVHRIILGSKLSSDYVDSKGELLVCDALDNENVRSSSMMQTLLSKRQSKNSLQSLQALVTDTAGSAMNNRSRAFNNSKTSYKAAAPKEVVLLPRQSILEEGASSMAKEQRTRDQRATLDGRQGTGYAEFSVSQVSNGSSKLKNKLNSCGLKYYNTKKPSNRDIQREISLSNNEEKRAQIAREKQSKTVLFKQTANESQKDTARRIIKQIPSKIKIIENETEKRYFSQPRSSLRPPHTLNIEEPSTCIYPISIKQIEGSPKQHQESFDNGPYNFKPLEKRNFMHRGMLEKQGSLLPLDPPKVDVHIKASELRATGISPMSDRLTERIQLQKQTLSIRKRVLQDFYQAMLSAGQNDSVRATLIQYGSQNSQERTAAIPQQMMMLKPSLPQKTKKGKNNGTLSKGINKTRPSKKEDNNDDDWVKKPLLQVTKTRIVSRESLSQSSSLDFNKSQRSSKEKIQFDNGNVTPWNVEIKMKKKKKARKDHVLRTSEFGPFEVVSDNLL